MAYAESGGSSPTNLINYTLYSMYEPRPPRLGMRKPRLQWACLQGS